MLDPAQWTWAAWGPVLVRFAFALALALVATVAWLVVRWLVFGPDRHRPKVTYAPLDETLAPNDPFPPVTETPSRRP